MKDSDRGKIRIHGLPFGLDAAQLLSLLARSAQLLSGFVTLSLVVYFFDLKTQGYFFTFNSLIALQVFAEMGLNMVLIQFAAHEMARLRWTDEGIITGDFTAKSRLRSLLMFALGWFGIAAVLLVVILIPAGAWFFGRPSMNLEPPAHLLVHWNLLVVSISGNLIVTALFSVIEGAGKVSEVASVRLAQFIGGALIGWTAIILGAGLLALALQYAVMMTIGIVYLVTRRLAFIEDMIRSKLKPRALNWRLEILPFQWRIAVSCLSGYFVFQYTTPLLFATQGPEAAGRMGLTMQVFSAISSLCIIFVTARSPAFGQLVSSSMYTKLDHLFKRSVVQSFTALGLTVFLALSTIIILSRYYTDFGARLLPLSQTVALSLACIGSHAVYAQSIYLRAHKQEPFMKLSVINAVLMAALSTWAIPRAGTAGAVAAYVFVTLAISTPLGTWIYLRFEPDRARG